MGRSRGGLTTKDPLATDAHGLPLEFVLTPRQAGCPVLALAQFSRRIEMENRSPKMSDLRDSGIIEQDADAIITIMGKPGESKRTLHILKQRQGSTGVVHLNFDGPTQRWSGA